MAMNEDNNRFDAETTNKMGNDYFDNLYDDLPKEIADLLKSNHPFAESTDAEETLEEKRARRAAMRKEAKTTRKSSRHDRVGKEAFAEPVKEPETEVIDEPAAEEPEAEEVIAKKHVFDESAIIKKAMEEADIAVPEEVDEMPPVEEEPVEEEEPEDDVKIAHPIRKSKRNDYDDDFDENDKEAAFNRFFGDDDDYIEEERGGILGKIILVILLLIAIAAAGFFGMKYMGVKGELANSVDQTETIEEYKAENEELKLKVVELEDEIVSLKAELEAASTAAEPAGEGTSLTAPADGNNETSAPAASTSSTYTVKDGDSYWSIAAKVYGDGTKFQKILDANGLKESDELSIGQTLTIPSL